MAASPEDVRQRIDDLLANRADLRRRTSDLVQAPIADQFLLDRAAAPVSRDTVNLLASTVDNRAPNVAALAAGFLSTQVDARDAALLEIQQLRRGRQEQVQTLQAEAAGVNQDLDDLQDQQRIDIQAAQQESLAIDRQERRANEARIQDRLEREQTVAEDSRRRRDRIAEEAEERLGVAAQTDRARTERLNRLTDIQIELSQGEGRLFQLSQQAETRKRIIRNLVNVEALREGLTPDETDRLLQDRVANDTMLNALQSEAQRLLSGQQASSLETLAEEQEQPFDPFLESGAN